MDKKTLNKENYNLENGSTIAILKSSYLDTLSEGLHTLTFVYTDGEVSTNIEIAKANVEIYDTTKNPATGDNIILYIGLMLISMLVFSIKLNDNPEKTDYSKASYEDDNLHLIRVG